MSRRVVVTVAPVEAFEHDRLGVVVVFRSSVDSNPSNLFAVTVEDGGDPQQSVDMLMARWRAANPRYVFRSSAPLN